MIVLGVDPGLDGGIVIFEDGVVAGCHEMPTIGAKAKRAYSASGIAAILAAHTGATVFCEQAPAAFRIGGKVIPTGKLMLCQGLVEGAATALGLRFVAVPAKTWQKVAFVGTDGSMPTKYRALQAAQRLFPPELVSQFERGARKRHFHDGLIDAALIAYYAMTRGEQ